jgi:hypothetical protein
MRRCIVTVVALVAILSARRAQSGPPPHTDVMWHSSYTEARELAKSSGKPLLVQFR